MVDDAFNAEDLLTAAADRMRRSRETRRTQTAAAAGTGSRVYTGGSVTATTTAPATATAVGGLPARALFVDSRRRAGGVGVGVDVAGSAEFAAVGGAGGGGRSGARHGRRRASPLSPSLSASVPIWRGLGGGGGGGGGGGDRVGGSAERLRRPSQPGRRRGAWGAQDDDDVVVVEGEGNREGGVDIDMDMDGAAGALVVVSAAAMDVLRELEHMHVGVGWFACLGVNLVTMFRDRLKLRGTNGKLVNPGVLVSFRVGAIAGWHCLARVLLRLAAGALGWLGSLLVLCWGVVLCDADPTKTPKNSSRRSVSARNYHDANEDLRD